jgi:hypothetical protein
MPTHPPIFYVSQAMVQHFGANRFVPKNIFIALFCNFFIILSVYFLIRNLYGFWYAFLSGFILIFPFRNFMSYAWGQRPILIAMGFIPIILYSFYKYCNSFFDGKEAGRYLFLIALLSGSIVFLHIVALWPLAIILSLYALFFYFKHRIIPFGIKTIGISLLFFLLISLPFMSIFSSNSEATESDSFSFKIVSPLLSWYGELHKDNLFMYDFASVHGGLWILPFIILGLLYFIIKRRDNDLLMLSWFIGIYLSLHFAFGLFEGRIDRIFKGESHLFYPIAAIGLLSLPKYFKISKSIKSIVNIVLVIAFIVMTFSFNAPKIYDTSMNLYPSFQRLTPVQMEMTEWVDENLPEKAIIFHQPSRDLIPSLSGWAYQKYRWKQIFSHRALHDVIDEYSFTHAIIDYSDFILVNSNDAIVVLKQWEESNMKNNTLLYDKNNIKVYELG